MSQDADMQPPASPAVVGLIIATGIGLPSALLYAIPIGQRVIGLLLLILTLAYYAISSRRISLGWIIALVFGVLLSTITAFYWGNPSIVLVLGYIVLAVCLVGMSTIQEITRAVEITTVILIGIVILAWVALVYALGGGGPIWELGNPGQPLSLYLTSLALSVHGERVGNLIRPAGIFDEPGALAFFIALCAACRMLLDLPRRTTWLLLLAGVVTMSLALFVFILVTAVGETFVMSRTSKAARIGVRKSGWKLAFAGSVLLLALTVRYYAEISLVLGFLFSRLEFSSGDGARILAGDSRTDQLLAAVETLNLRVFLFGSSESCFVDLQDCATLGLGGGNPLWPLLVRGALAQFLYYFILAMMLLKAMMMPKRAAVYVAVVLMFFQRPYVLALGYSTWAAMIVMMDAKALRPSFASSRRAVEATS